MNRRNEKQTFVFRTDACFFRSYMIKSNVQNQNMFPNSQLLPLFGKVGCQTVDKLGVFRLFAAGIRYDFFQKFPIPVVPDGIDKSADVAFDTKWCGLILICHFIIQPFALIESSLAFHDELYSAGRIEKAQIPTVASEFPDQFVDRIFLINQDSSSPFLLYMILYYFSISRERRK